MASIPDSHTSIFTRIPSRIEKTWSVRTHQCGPDSQVVPPDTKHSQSIIREIGFSVAFDDDAMNDEPDLTEVADRNTDSINVWQEARRDWADLEEAIADAIKSINARNWKRAQESKLRTVDVLNSVRTRPVFKHYTPTPRSILRDTSTKSLLQSDKRVRTIHPNESASVAGIDQMRSLLDEIIRGNADPTARGSQPSKSRRSTDYVKVRRRTTN